MNEIVWTRAALTQLTALLAYIAEDDPCIADTVARRIEGAVGRLENFPESAPIYVAPLRRLCVQGLPMSCYYEFIDGMVRILAVRHDHAKNQG